MNGLLVAVAGLIALAVGNEHVIAHPHGQGPVTVSLLLFGGPLLYLLSQTYYLWAVVGMPSVPRVAGSAAFVAAGALALVLPPVAALGLLASLLAILVAAVLAEGGRRDRHVGLLTSTARRASSVVRGPRFHGEKGGYLSHWWECLVWRGAAHPVHPPVR